MRQSERVTGAPRIRHVNSNGSRVHANGHAKTSIKQVVKLARGLPRRLRRDMETHPEAVLATVGGASFLVGAIFGSRLGRVVLASAIPLGLQYLIESEVGPRL